jgi:hypothetical protein
MHSATANDALLLLAAAPATSARAMPMDTAVAATAVDIARATEVSSSTHTMERRSDVGELSFLVILISNESAPDPSRGSPVMPAPVRPDLGEAVDEYGPFRVFG